MEVIGRHNNTLETLDIHDTLMTTPTINKVCSMTKTWSRNRGKLCGFRKLGAVVFQPQLARTLLYTGPEASKVVFMT